MSNAAPPQQKSLPAPVLARFSAVDAAATASLAARIGRIVCAGDVLLLSGDLGSGKTHFARALIQSRQAEHGAPEDVPSPSFTLVQTYHAGDLEIWHADLYRLTHPDEVVELGLDQAMDGSLCLIEWPERMAGDWPATAAWLIFALAPNLGEEARQITLCAGADTSVATRLVAAMEAE